ncbi:NAD(P)-binding protein [Hypomontagnella monticulosa]|nr:NAD(P)-binding protein [Hypomontagnella monticulosa]
MATTFDITPEKEGSVLNYFWRQLTQTPAEVTGVDLSKRVAIVTGSNVGIGLECGRQLLDLGLSKLILAVRNISKGEAAAVELFKERNLEQDAIEVWELDYSSYDSVMSFADQAKGLERLDIVILNAGIMTTEMKINPNTGHEETIQTNYLSTSLLTILLIPVLKAKRAAASPPGRITITSSDTAAWARLDNKESPLLASFDKPGNIDMTNRTFVSKLLGQLFLVELAKRVPSSVVVVNAATPMMVHDSEISRDTAQSLVGKIAEVFRRRIGYTSAVGARMIVDAAVNHGEETHGQYLGLQKLKPMAPIIYSPGGERLGELLWKETLEEFSFAQVEDIIKEISR